MFNLSPESRRAVLDKLMRRGDDAKRIMSDPLVVTALDSMEADIIASLKGLKAGDTEGRDTLWRELRAHERFKAKFANYIRSGALAAKEINQ